MTGLPDPTGLSVKRPALTIKIENTPQALPQWGIDQADVVYEEIVNGGITRLAAIFNSHAPAKVGPVRSVRPTDTQVVWPLGGIFAYSGGAPYAVASISTAPVKLIDESSAGAAMFRDPDLYAPHNLFAVAPQLLFKFGGTPGAAAAALQLPAAKTKLAGGTTVASFIVPFPSYYPVTWTWDTASSSWDRTLFGMADVTGTGVRESPKNVIVMWVNYVNGIGTEASYGNLQGSGTAAFFVDGKETTGTWSRGPSKADIIQYKTLNGKPTLLTPGQTWVELLNVGTTLAASRSNGRLESFQRHFHGRTILFGKSQGDDGERPRTVVVEGLGDERAALDLLEVVAPDEQCEVVPRDAAILFELDDAIARDVAETHLHVHRERGAERQSSRRALHRRHRAGAVQDDVLARVAEQIEDPRARGRGSVSRPKSSVVTTSLQRMVGSWHGERKNTMNYNELLLDLPDGRTLQVATLGEPSGKTVLFHHGTPGSANLVKMLAPLAEDGTLFVVTTSRAGYGKSSRLKGRNVASVD